MFSFKEKCFVKIDDANYDALHAEYQTEHEC